MTASADAATSPSRGGNPCLLRGQKTSSAWRERDNGNARFLTVYSQCAGKTNRFSYGLAALRFTPLLLENGTEHERLLQALNAIVG